VENYTFLTLTDYCLSLVCCSLQQVLTVLQQRQLDELSDWLHRMEALVSQDELTNGEPEPLQKRLEQHKVCWFDWIKG